MLKDKKQRNYRFIKKNVKERNREGHCFDERLYLWTSGMVRNKNIAVVCRVDQCSV